jgi:hypothetical protein
MTSASSPILLFGMPRSGTTWIGKIFDSHPDTLYRHEPDSWGTLNEIPLFPLVDDPTPSCPVIQRFIGGLADARKTKVAGSLPVFHKRGESAARHAIRQTGILAVKSLSRAFGEIAIPRFFDTPLSRFRPVWKSIESTGRLGLILRCAPETRAIHILRHPCGFVSSVLRGEARNKFEGGRDSEDFGMFELLCGLPQARRRGLKPTDFRDMAPAQRLAWRWLLVNEKAMEECRDLDNYLPLNYDQTCADPVEQARTMFEFAGLDWPAQTNGFVSASTKSENPTYYSVFKDPLKSANKWRQELSAEDIRGIAGIVGDSAPGRLFAFD